MFSRQKPNNLLPVYFPGTFVSTFENILQLPSVTVHKQTRIESACKLFWDLGHWPIDDDDCDYSDGGMFNFGFIALIKLRGSQEPCDNDSDDDDNPHSTTARVPTFTQTFILILTG